MLLQELENQTYMDDFLDEILSDPKFGVPTHRKVLAANRAGTSAAVAAKFAELHSEKRRPGRPKAPAGNNPATSKGRQTATAMEVALQKQATRDAEWQALAEQLSGIKVQVAEAKTAVAGVGRDDGVDDSDIEDGPPLAATTAAEFELCHQTFLALKELERKV